MNNHWIHIVNATQNNLKNVSVAIPKHHLTVVTGVSGSGKSSLVFDTLAAESRRELNDTFSSYIQHMLPKYGRPTVERIDNLPVAIPIEQKNCQLIHDLLLEPIQRFIRFCGCFFPELDNRLLVILIHFRLTIQKESVKRVMD